MRHPIEIEDIQEKRRLEGIDDIELHRMIRGLVVGDCVKLTFVSGPNSFETLAVRITSIRGFAFRGKLATSPASIELADLHAGSVVVFTTTHIHSLAKGQPAHDH